MSDDDKDNGSWVERARDSVEKGLEFIKENGSELFGKAVTVTGVVAVTSYAATFFGVELEDGAGWKMAAAAVIAGYKVYSAIKEHIRERKRDQSQESAGLEVISIEDYRALQANLDQVLDSHDAVIYALNESKETNSRLLRANEELVSANEKLREALRQRHQVELDVAESSGVIERVDFQYQEGESIVRIADDGGEPVALENDLEADEPTYLR